MTPYICVGGPLDGQHRTVPNDALSFWVTKPSRLSALPGGSVYDGCIEYRLVWSSDHGRMIWWAKEGEQ